MVVCLFVCLNYFFGLVAFFLFSTKFLHYRMSSHNINTTHKSSLFILYTNIKNLQRINVGSITGAHYALKTRPLSLSLSTKFCR